MEENDLGNYQLKLNGSIDNTDDYSLTGLERIQKQQLFVHLLANSEQSLLVCGPEGIGKSRIVKNLQKQQAQTWVFFSIVGQFQLDLHKVLDKINEETAQSPKQSRLKKVVLFEDAGRLPAGLIDQILESGLPTADIRLVFFLSHDDLYVKSFTDKRIDDCYLIEIPPLTENQCGDFVRGLSAKPWIRLSGNEINERFIASIYQQSNGVPGEIIAKLPTVAGHKRVDTSLWLLLLALVILIAIALGLQWYSQKHNGLNFSFPSRLSLPAFLLPSSPPEGKDGHQ
ncbi:hypothetical protein JCM14076_25640 [Methylosoma difficile]